ncbi:MAG: polyhydroxybutyrate depolymerase [Pseudomonadota bacterium]
MFRRLIMSLAAMLISAATALATPSCGGVNAPCQLAERSYHLRAPDGWDGETALPVLLHFHGWMRQGDLVIRHERIASATRKRGVLLVAPNGIRKTWNFWGNETEDVPFAASVLEDVARHYPIDRERIFVSGYSFGSAMAWRYVCQNGDGVSALLAVAGSLKQTEVCPQAPGQVRHVHGLKDRVMDFPMGPGGDTTYPVVLWRAKYGCQMGELREPWQARDFLTFERTVWNCTGGSVTLDLHPGGHFIPHGWIARQLDEILGLPPSYP